MTARLFVLCALLVGAIGERVAAQVTWERLLNAKQEPHNWLTYGGTYESQRYTTLDQITPANVGNLELKWVFQSQLLEPFETTPLVVDGILYTVQGNDVVALDAATGQRFWMYRHQQTPGAVSCCSLISRGVGILNETIFLGAGDARLIALDAKTGKPLWDVTVGKATAGYSIKHAPLVIKDKVLVGMHGGEYGVRGFIAAFDAATGKEVWRFNTVAGPGEPGADTWGGDSWQHGGGSLWVSGTYDADANLTYWGVGNPGPDYNGDVRPGDNLYTCAVVALDADTGKLKWHYQYNPHNEFDWDAVQVPLLADLQWQGKPRKVILTAQRNGFFYVLDRLTGEFLLAKPFVRQNWNAGFDEKGRPIMAPNAKSSVEGTLIYPGNQGGTNWFSPSYSPRTGLFYVNAWENTATIFAKREAEYQEGRIYMAGANRGIVPPGIGFGMPRGRQPFNYRMEEELYAAVRALDPQTGERKWEFKLSDATYSGILTTASDLLFTGVSEGYFLALDARSGTLLWKAMLGGNIIMGPMSYAVAGKQYVAVAAGNSLFVYALR
jgi:alcohol dehydrogenase (cytochrome c)